MFFILLFIICNSIHAGVCLNGGIWSGRSCNCLSGFAGDYCEKLHYSSADKPIVQLTTLLANSLTKFDYTRYFRPYNPCNNGGFYTNSSCVCLPGYGGTYCDSLSCMNGEFDSDSNSCLCYHGWTGTSCNICKMSDVCDGTMICDSTLIETDYKQVKCTTDNPEITNVMGNNFNFICTSIQNNGTCFLHVFDFTKDERTGEVHQLPVMYCSLDQCVIGAQWKVGIPRDYVMNYDCEIALCNCTGSKCFNGPQRKIIESIDGHVAMKCDNSTRKCTVDIYKLPFKPVPLECFSGKCADSYPLPPITPILPLPVPWYVWFAVVAGICGIIFLSIVSLLCIISIGREYARKSFDATVGSSICVSITGYDVPVGLKSVREFLSFSNLCDCFISKSCRCANLVQFIKDTFSSKIYRYNEILRDINFELSSGESIIIFGHSGSGKTTLFKIASGLSLPGIVYGDVIIKNAKNTNYIAFAGTGDELFMPGILTVWEYTTCATRLRCKYTPELEKELDELFDQFGINNIKNSSLSVISFGEKKRVSIVCQLIIKPTVLFIDELTNGLSPGGAIKIISDVMKYTKTHNITLAVTIHQIPGKIDGKDITDFFNKVLILKQGHVVFYNDAKHLIPAFTKHKICDMGDDSITKITKITNQFEIVTMDEAKTIRLNIDKIISEINNDSLLQKEKKKEEEKKSYEIKYQEGFKNINLNEAPLNPNKIDILEDDLSRLMKNEETSKRQLEENEQRIDLYFNSPEDKRKTPQKIIGINTINCNNTCRTGRAYQIFCLMKYNMIAISRSIHVYILSTVIMALLGLLVGVAGFQLGYDLKGALSRSGIIGFSLFVIALISINSINVFNTHKVKYTYEHTGGYYYALSYFVSSIVTDWLVWKILECLVFICGFYFLNGFSLDVFVWFVVVEMLFTITYGAFGLILSSCIRYPYLSYMIYIIVLIITVLGSGVIVNFNAGSGLMSVLKALSPISYAIESILCNELDNKGIEISPGIVLEGSRWLRELNMSGSRFPVNLIILSGFPIILLSAAFLAMYYCLKVKV